MKLSDVLRREVSALGKWPDWPQAVQAMRRAANELDRREARIKRLEKST